MSGKNDIRGIVFDLFGTLTSFNQRRFIRDVLSAFNTSVMAGSLASSLNQLMVTSYEDNSKVLEHWCRTIGIGNPSDDDKKIFDQILKHHLDTVEFIPGAESVLRFYSSKGYKLGLLSNSTQSFRDSFLNSELSKYFDEIVFSCDIGISKPDRAAYELIARKLDLKMEECLFVGDSKKNDYEAPKKFGMSAYHVKSKESWYPSSITQMLWGKINSNMGIKQLVSLGQIITIDNSTFEINSIEDMNFELQGKYNFVLKCHCLNVETKESQVIYLKRYMHEEAAHVEHLAYKVLGILGLSDARSTIIPGPESIFAVTEVPGHEWVSTNIDSETAYSAGQHCAAAYIMANADLRPRNTLISSERSTKRHLNIIDLEHCFFDRAIVTESISNRFNPHEIEKFATTIDEITKTRALSVRAIRRTRKEFLKINDQVDELAVEFERGWFSTLDTALSKSKAIEATLKERVHEKPYIVIGTNSYRRAMCGIDVNDIMHRIRNRCTKEDFVNLAGFG